MSKKKITDNILHSTKWLTLKERSFKDKTGKQQTWDFISRKNDQQVVTLICRSKRYNRFLFIKQYRVPINQIVIEFPAGLMDPKESPEKAALRELKEETGYKGDIIEVSHLFPKSAGLSDEKTYFIECIVDENAVGDTEMEITENIQAFWKTPKQLYEMSQKLDPKEVTIAAEVWSFILGYLKVRKK